MLIAAAAALGQWNRVPKAESGSVVHPQSQRRATYGELAAKAAELAPPQKRETESAHRMENHRQKVCRARMVKQRLSDKPSLLATSNCPAC